MGSFNPNYFLHTANILLLVAYSVRDILWLRLFAVASAVIAIPYFVLQPAPLWVPIGWSALFASINLFQSWRIFLERRPVKLTPDEEMIRRLGFEDLPPRKFLQLLSVGTWTTVPAGERIVEHDKPPENVLLIVQGTVRIVRNGRTLGELVAGHLAGSTLLFSGVVADVDAVASEPVRAFSWQIETLEPYLAANPDVRIVVQRHLVRDLAGKLVSYVGSQNS